MKQILLVSSMLAITSYMYAQSADTNPKENKQTISASQNLFHFSTELENARQSYLNAQTTLATSSRATAAEAQTSFQEAKKAYLDLLEKSKNDFKNDPDKLILIREEIERINK